MKITISRRITLYLVAFSVLIIGLIAIASKFFLPSYYTNYQVDLINDYSGYISDVYDEQAPEDAIMFMEELQKQVGGELYIQSDQGQFQGYGKGKNAQYPMNNQEKFIPEGNVTSYTYTNKVGLDIFALGMNVDGEYLVYEVSIQSLDDVINVVFRFLGVILLIVLALSLVISYAISNSISKPIRALNTLAKDMKGKKVQAVMVAENDDEIGELNRSLNELYEELLSSIYHLETELNKERNAEVLKKRFLAQATHELKTPIAIIRGFAEILYDGMYKNTEEHDKYIRNIYEETEAISHLILDVLDYTKMETGNYKLQRSQVNSQEFFEETIGRLADYVRKEGLEADVFNQIDAGHESYIDGRRVEQILRNLVSNAVEHATSKVAIKVVETGERLRIEVGNDGPHIDEVDLPNIFNSFYKTSGKQSGSGLGLAIVKEIVLLHQGDYRVENTEKGVNFLVYL